MEITIKDKQYKIKFTLRALILFEKVTGTNFKYESFTDQLLYFYCLILANNEDAELSIEDLIDAMDNDPSIFAKYVELVTKNNDKNAQLTENTVSDSKKV